MNKLNDLLDFIMSGDIEIEEAHDTLLEPPLDFEFNRVDNSDDTSEEIGSPLDYFNVQLEE